MIQASIDRRSLRSLAILALLIAVAGGAGKRALAREEPIQSLSLPNVRPEVEPRADLGPDAPPPSYPLEEVNQNVFRGVRHGFVNTTVGNIAFGVLDLKLPGHMPIEFRRVYDSGITAYLPPPPPGQQNEPRWSEDLGPNWALGYAGYLIAIAGGVVQATPEGDVLWWTEQTGGSFTRQFDAPTRHMKLQRSSSTVIVETQMDGTQYTYTWSVSTAGSAYLLTEIKDRSNNKVNLTYTQGYLSHVQNTDGAWIEITRPVYTANYPSTVFPRSRVVKLTDNTGRIVQFDYDSGGRLTRATDVFGKNWTYAYDATSNKLTSATTPLGDVYLTVSYDSQMRVSSYEANAGPWGFAYGAQTTVTDGLNHAWKYTPSSTGITTAVLEPTLGQHTIGLDANHNPTSYTGPMGEHAYWTYDSNHRPLTHTPAGTSSTITYVYDATNGWANTITSVTGGVTTFVRDSAGRVTEERDAYNNKTTATYAVNGDRLTMRLPNGNAANPVSGYLWTLTYDAYGNPITATDPTNRQFQMDYTAQGNLWKLRRPDHQDPVTHQTVYSQWTYNRDMAGRVTTTVDPLGNTWSRTYDDAGRLTRVQGPAGTNLRYVYDARYRLTALWNDAITPNVQLASYTYDAAGQLASQGVAAGGATTYGFDASNRLISVTDPLNRSWLYDRDSSGRVTKVTYPGGRYVTISRDSAGRIISRTYPSDPDNHYRLESYTYDAAGELLTANADEGPDTAHLTWTRDLLERPVSLATVVDYAAIGTGHSLGFTYDPDGNRSTLVEYAPGTTNPQKTYNYTYDTQDRLTQVTADGSTWQASYDSYSGLRTVVQVPAVTGTNTETWSYDAAGGLATHTWNRPDASDTGNETFTLDGEGRLLATANSTAGVQLSEMLTAEMR